jgi:hypothetical protein
MLYNWFRYSNRNESPYNPTIGTSITIERFWQKEEGNFNDPNWRREEWLIHSALVPLHQLNNAVIEIKSPHDLTFHIGWGNENNFEFGDYAKYGEIQLYPLALLTKHPISEDLIVQLSSKFVTYHALQKRNQSQYYHPIDNLLVAETNIETHKIYNPTGNVILHCDYLRDFLAAVKMGLFISVVADRFANAPTEEELELDKIEDEKIDEFTWLSTSMHSSKFTDHGYFRGRSILRRNFIIEPYDKPKFERSPWSYYGEKSIPEGELPQFIINSKGDKQVLKKSISIGDFGYIYFRPEVLQKYLQVPGYSVYFHMRNWGSASLPGDRGSIDVGINSHGLVNAFAPDIAELNSSEQAYWSSFSSLPSGEICEEMFQTRMLLNPPNSPGVVELIRDARSQLNTIYKTNFSVDLFNDMEPSKQELYRLSVGPISNQFSEVLELARIFYGWAIETMQIAPLQSVLKKLDVAVDKGLRQIKLLERILMAKGLDEARARSLSAPLVGLNELRIGSAHIGSLELESIFQLMGASTNPQTPREGWNLCIDAVIASLTLISNALQT